MGTPASFFFFLFVKYPERLGFFVGSLRIRGGP